MKTNKKEDVESAESGYITNISKCDVNKNLEPRLSAARTSISITSHTPSLGDLSDIIVKDFECSDILFGSNSTATLSNVSKLQLATNYIKPVIDEIIGHATAYTPTEFKHILLNKHPICAISYSQYSRAFRASEILIEVNKDLSLNNEYNPYPMQEMVVNTVTAYPIDELNENIVDAADRIYIDRDLMKQLVDLHELVTDTMQKLKATTPNENNNATNNRQEAPPVDNQRAQSINKSAKGTLIYNVEDTKRHVVEDSNEPERGFSIEISKTDPVTTAYTDKTCSAADKPSRGKNSEQSSESTSKPDDEITSSELKRLKLMFNELTLAVDNLKQANKEEKSPNACLKVDLTPCSPCLKKTDNAPVKSGDDAVLRTQKDIIEYLKELNNMKDLLHQIDNPELIIDPPNVTHEPCCTINNYPHVHARLNGKVVIIKMNQQTIDELTTDVGAPTDNEPVIEAVVEPLEDIENQAGTENKIISNNEIQKSDEIRKSKADSKRESKNDNKKRESRRSRSSKRKSTAKNEPKKDADTELPQQPETQPNASILYAKEMNENGENNNPNETNPLEERTSTGSKKSSPSTRLPKNENILVAEAPINEDHPSTNEQTCCNTDLCVTQIMKNKKVQNNLIQVSCRLDPKDEESKSNRNACINTECNTESDSITKESKTKGSTNAKVACKYVGCNTNMEEEELRNKPQCNQFIENNCKGEDCNVNAEASYAAKACMTENENLVQNKSYNTKNNDQKKPGCSQFNENNCKSVQCNTNSIPNKGICKSTECKLAYEKSESSKDVKHGYVNDHVKPECSEFKNNNCQSVDCNITDKKKQIHSGDTKTVSNKMGTSGQLTKPGCSEFKENACAGVECNIGVNDTKSTPHSYTSTKEKIILNLKMPGCSEFNSMCKSKDCDGTNRKKEQIINNSLQIKPECNQFKENACKSIECKSKTQKIEKPGLSEHKSNKCQSTQCTNIGDAPQECLLQFVNYNATSNKSIKPACSQFKENACRMVECTAEIQVIESKCTKQTCPKIALQGSNACTRNYTSTVTQKECNTDEPFAQQTVYSKKDCATKTSHITRSELKVQCDKETSNTKERTCHSLCTFLPSKPIEYSKEGANDMQTRDALTDNVQRMLNLTKEMAMQYLKCQNQELNRKPETSNAEKTTKPDDIKCMKCQNTECSTAMLNAEKNMTTTNSKPDGETIYNDDNKLVKCQNIKCGTATSTNEVNSNRLQNHCGTAMSNKGDIMTSKEKSTTAYIENGQKTAIIKCENKECNTDLANISTDAELQPTFNTSNANERDDNKHIEANGDNTDIYYCKLNENKTCQNIYCEYNIEKSLTGEISNKPIQSINCENKDCSTAISHQDKPESDGCNAAKYAIAKINDYIKCQNKICSYEYRTQNSTQKQDNSDVYRVKVNSENCNAPTSNITNIEKPNRDILIKCQNMECSQLDKPVNSQMLRDNAMYKNRGCNAILSNVDQNNLNQPPIGFYPKNKVITCNPSQQTSFKNTGCISLETKGGTCNQGVNTVMSDITKENVLQPLHNRNSNYIKCQNKECSTANLTNKQINANNTRTLEASSVDGKCQTKECNTEFSDITKEIILKPTCNKIIIIVKYENKECGTELINETGIEAVVCKPDADDTGTDLCEEINLKEDRDLCVKGNCTNTSCKKSRKSDSMLKFQTEATDIVPQISEFEKKEDLDDTNNMYKNDDTNNNVDRKVEGDEMMEQGEGDEMIEQADVKPIFAVKLDAEISNKSNKHIVTTISNNTNKNNAIEKKAQVQRNNLNIKDRKRPSIKSVTNKQSNLPITDELSCFELPKKDNKGCNICKCNKTKVPGTHRNVDNIAVQPSYVEKFKTSENVYSAAVTLDPDLYGKPTVQLYNTIGSSTSLNKTADESIASFDLFDDITASKEYIVDQCCTCSKIKEKKSKRMKKGEYEPIKVEELREEFLINGKPSVVLYAKRDMSKVNPECSKCCKKEDNVGIEIPTDYNSNLERQESMNDVEKTYDRDEESQHNNEYIDKSNKNKDFHSTSEMVVNLYDAKCECSEKKVSKTCKKYDHNSRIVADGAMVGKPNVLLYTTLDSKIIEQPTETKKPCQCGPQTIPSASQRSKSKKSLKQTESKKSLRHTASKKSLKATASKKSLKKTASKKSLKATASKKSLKKTASKKSLKQTASRKSLKQTASRKSLKQTASKKSLKQTASKKSLKKTASRKSLKQTASRKSLKGSASKKSLKKTASRKSLKPTASKKSLKASASKKSLKKTASRKSLKPTASKKSLKASASKKSLKKTASRKSLKPTASKKSLKASASKKSLKKTASRKSLKPTASRKSLRDKTPINTIAGTTKISKACQCDDDLLIKPNDIPKNEFKKTASKKSLKEDTNKKSLRGTASKKSLKGTASKKSLKNTASKKSLKGNASKKSLKSTASKKSIKAKKPVKSTASKKSLKGNASKKSLKGASSKKSLKGASSKKSLKGASSKKSLKGRASKKAVGKDGSANVLEMDIKPYALDQNKNKSELDIVMSTIHAKISISTLDIETEITNGADKSNKDLKPSHSNESLTSDKEYVKQNIQYGTEATPMKAQNKSLNRNESNKSFGVTAGRKQIISSENKNKVDKSKSVNQNSSIDLNIKQNASVKSIKQIGNKKSLNTTASKKSLKKTASKKSLKGTSSKKSLKGTASKKSLKGTASKKSLKGTASKKSLKGTASKKSLKQSASKKSLKGASSRKSIKQNDKQKSISKFTKPVKKNCGCRERWKIKQLALQKQSLAPSASRKELKQSASKKSLKGTASKKSLKGTASKKSLKGTASKKSLKGTASKKSLKGTASKKSLKGTASKKSLKGTASKKSLKGTASKKSLKGTASKKSLKNSASKKSVKDTAGGKSLKETDTDKRTSRKSSHVKRNQIKQRQSIMRMPGLKGVPSRVQNFEFKSQVSVREIERKPRPSEDEKNRKKGHSVTTQFCSSSTGNPIYKSDKYIDMDVSDDYLDSLDIQDSEPSLPYTVNRTSLPNLNICPPMQVDVETLKIYMQSESINHPRHYIKQKLKSIGIDSLLRASKPAKCCRKAVINEKPDEAAPFHASLNSLPLTDSDLKVIVKAAKFENRCMNNCFTQIYQSKFEYYTNFQENFASNLDYFIPKPQVYEVRYFEFLKKEEEHDKRAKKTETEHKFSHDNKPDTKSNGWHLFSDFKLSDIMRKFINSSEDTSNSSKSKPHKSVHNKKCQTQNRRTSHNIHIYRPSTKSLPLNVKYDCTLKTSNIVMCNDHIPERDIPYSIKYEQPSTSMNTSPPIQLVDALGDTSSLSPKNFAETLSAVYELDENGNIRQKQIDDILEDNIRQPTIEQTTTYDIRNTTNNNTCNSNINTFCCNPSNLGTIYETEEKSVLKGKDVSENTEPPETETFYDYIKSPEVSTSFQKFMATEDAKIIFEKSGINIKDFMDIFLQMRHSSTEEECVGELNNLTLSISKENHISHHKIKKQPSKIPKRIHSKTLNLSPVSETSNFSHSSGTISIRPKLGYETTASIERIYQSDTSQYQSTASPAPIKPTYPSDTSRYQSTASFIHKQGSKSSLHRKNKYDPCILETEDSVLGLTSNSSQPNVEAGMYSENILYNLIYKTDESSTLVNINKSTETSTINERNFKARKPSIVDETYPVNSSSEEFTNILKRTFSNQNLNGKSVTHYSANSVKSRTLSEKSTLQSLRKIAEKDGPGYISVLHPICGCPEVSIFIPCYCDDRSCGSISKNQLSPQFMKQLSSDGNRHHFILPNACRIKGNKPKETVIEGFTFSKDDGYLNNI